MASISRSRMTLPFFTSRSTGMKVGPSIPAANLAVRNRVVRVRDWDCAYSNYEVRRE